VTRSERDSPTADASSLGTASTTGYPGTPRWVKVSAAIVLVLVLIFLGLHLSGGGGPVSHLPPAAAH
jgi:hypothetical protein